MTLGIRTILLVVLQPYKLGQISACFSGGSAFQVDKVVFGLLLIFNEVRADHAINLRLLIGFKGVRLSL